MRHERAYQPAPLSTRWVSFQSHLTLNALHGTVGSVDGLTLNEADLSPNPCNKITVPVWFLAAGTVSAAAAISKNAPMFRALIGLSRLGM